MRKNTLAALIAVVALIAVLALAVAFAFWLGRRSTAGTTAPGAPAPRAAPLSAADLDTGPETFAVGQRVEALARGGWTPAVVVELGAKDALVRYEEAGLGEERVDLRLLRSVEATPTTSTPTVTPPTVTPPPPREDPQPPIPPPPPPPEPPAGEQAGARYVGCFKDTSVLDLDGFLVRSATNTPQTCIETCRRRGFRYAGVQYGESCLCGNSYGRYGPADNCNYNCTGDHSQVCGGYSANSVYEIGEPR